MKKVLPRQHTSGETVADGQARKVCLPAYSHAWNAEISLARFLWRHWHVRAHSSLRGKTPYEA
jgi:hypothetical protein